MDDCRSAASPVDSALTRERDEPVRLTRIYTRGGDAGETSLGDGSRVSKLDPLVLALRRRRRAQLAARPGRRSCCATARLERIQNELFDLGADLCVPFAATTGSCASPRRRSTRLEADCDEANAPLPELRSFVLPGGTEGAARLHVARAACRRAEREVLAAAARDGRSTRSRPST